MWTRKGCILTTRDFAILEILHEQRTELDQSLAALLRHKLASAAVVFHDDVPPDAATLNSRVRYRVGGNAPATRIITHDATQAMVGLALPLTTLRGLALLGLREGEAIILPQRGAGLAERITLEAVLYQPERAGRSAAERVRMRPALRLVHDADAIPPPLPRERGGGEDPGPSAA